MKKYFSILMCVATILTACVPVKAPQAIPTATLVSPTPAQQSTLTATLSSTSTPLPTLTATLLPTLTPLPTLPAAEAKSQVVELLKTNKGCKLPCFWGIIPGLTSWDETKNFLDSFSSQSETLNFTKSPGFFGDFYFTHDGKAIVDLHLSMVVKNNLIQEISVMDFDVPSYHLAGFLSNNGTPDQVWLRTYSQVSYGGGDVVPFLIYLFYKDAQMIIAYGYGQGTVSGDQIQGCIDGSPSLYIWSLDRPLTFQEAGKLGGYLQPNDKVLEISDATQGKMDANKFFETFKEPSVVPCFQTPKNLWPLGN